MADISTSGTRAQVTVPVLPVPGGVVFPGTVVTLALDSAAARDAVDGARSAGGPLLLVPELDGRTAAVGTLAIVENAGELPGGGRGAILRGTQRARVGGGVITDRPGMWVLAEPLTDGRPSADTEAKARELRVVLEAVAELRRSRRLPEILRSVSDPGALADAATAWADNAESQKLAVLEAVDVDARVALVLEWAHRLLDEMKVEQQIRSDVAEGVEKNQREYLLRQQLQAIRKELGEDGEDGGTDYRAKAAELPLPEAVRAFVEREIDRLDRSGPQNPESGWIRTWLDRVLDLPWGQITDDQLDLREARSVLDADHYGLDDVKERIIEFLAVRKLRRERSTEIDTSTPVRRGDGAIVCLVGPPGVGKTSLGESIARAMGRKFVRVALGGIRDEAEVRGHRRTYVGAQPGRIVRAITEAGTMNPVVLLDEIDKLSPGGWAGDPTAALLEVLDPAQNHTFRDHYLEIDLDLSQVVFIATANVADTIPGPLLDRMDLVRLDGYTDDEKVFIARNHLLPRLYERTALRSDEVVITDDAIGTVIEGYTREAGVRTLERELGRLLRKAATRIAVGDDGGVVDIGAGDVATHLGRKKVHLDVAERTAVPGVATGLAVTGAGGDVLFIEASSSPGEPALVLTGQLGDVMKESAQIALSYVRANQARLGLDGSGLDRRFHVHVPAGAVPKDGPSAGVTLTTALVSLLSGRPVKPSVGMTGEVTLQGKVLPIGGVKQKVMAAHRAGLTDVVLPRRNEVDVDDVPERVRQAVTIHFADTIDDVLAVALS
jgi:ATP-dependent Lon protease